MKRVSVRCDDVTFFLFFVYVNELMQRQQWPEKGINTTTIHSNRILSTDHRKKKKRKKKLSNARSSRITKITQNFEFQILTQMIENRNAS